MAIFNSYVSSPEGRCPGWCSQRLTTGIPFFPPDRQDPNFRRSFGVRGAHRGKTARGGGVFFSTSWPSKLVQHSWEFLFCTTKNNKDNYKKRWRPCYKTTRTLRQFSGSVFFLGGGWPITNTIIYIYMTFLDPPSILTNRVLPQILLLPMFL